MAMSRSRAGTPWIGLPSMASTRSFSRKPASAAADVRGFEKRVLEKIGMPQDIALRPRPQQFGHLFSGGHYASGYYSYMWSEVMDADAFAAFEEVGNPFDPETAARLERFILSAGGSEPPEALYTQFRGRMPGVEALLKGRGLLDAA